MKILIIADTLVRGGKERRIAELIKGLANNKDIEFQIAAMNANVGYSIFARYKIPIHYLIRRRKKDPIIFFKLYSLCKDFRPDIIHSWDPMTALYVALICKILSIKHINSMITIAPENLKKISKAYIMAKLSIPFSNIICSNSKAGLKSFNIPRKKGCVIYNGFDLNRINKLKEKELVKNTFKITSNRICVMVANFTNYKDYSTYLTAAKSIIASKTDVCFLAIGEGPNLKHYKESNVDDRIKFLGRITEVESIVNICDIGILVSSNGEGISNSILEYMALRKPVIATNNGGNKEVVVNNETGFLIPHYDVYSLIEKINYLLDNPQKGKSMGEKGYEIITEKFNYDNFINQFYELYKNSIN